MVLQPGLGFSTLYLANFFHITDIIDHMLRSCLLEVEPLTLLHSISDRKGPFTIPSIVKWYYSFHKSLELSVPSNFCRLLSIDIVIKLYINHKTRTCTRLFQSHKLHLLVSPLGPYHRPKCQISLSFTPLGWILLV